MGRGATWSVSLILWTWLGTAMPGCWTAGAVWTEVIVGCGYVYPPVAEGAGSYWRSLRISGEPPSRIRLDRLEATST